MTELEIHPIKNGFVSKETETLIIGTFPPKSEYTNNEHFFFYSSPRNHFWNRIESIFPNIEIKLKKTKVKLRDISPEQNKCDKQNFATKEKIGFLDVFTKIERKQIDSSKDIDLIPKETIIDNEILFEALDDCKSINRICCTYKLAYDTLLCGLDKNNMKYQLNTDTANREEYIFSYNSRKVIIVLLYPATRSRHKGELKDDQYKNLIFRI